MFRHSNNITGIHTITKILLDDIFTQQQYYRKRIKCPSYYYYKFNGQSYKWEEGCFLVSFPAQFPVNIPVSTERMWTGGWSGGLAGRYSPLQRQTHEIT